jgi:transcriptional regulator with XRE-family HTH domain
VPVSNRRTQQHVKLAAASRRQAGEHLGDRLRRLRRQRGWTLAQVSVKSGLAISTLSKVENNQIALTYHNLAKLAVGLDLDLADFFTPETIGERSGRRRVCRRGEGRLHESANYAHEYLCAELSRRRMIPLYTRVKARSLEEFGDLIQHPGEEFLFVLEGAIDLYIAPDKPMRLRAGDSCYFDGEAGHAAVTVSINDAMILTVMSAPPHVRPEEVA